MVKEGWLQKQSFVTYKTLIGKLIIKQLNIGIYIRSWRERWVVLTPNALFTFKNQKAYKNPTQIIENNAIILVKQKNDIIISLNVKMIYLYI